MSLPPRKLYIPNPGSRRGQASKMRVHFSPFLHFWQTNVASPDSECPLLSVPTVLVAGAAAERGRF